MSGRDSGDEILIIDDEPRDSGPLAAIFRSEGFCVATFEDGDLFIGAVRARPAACLILDVNMPERSGLEVLKEIDAANHDALVVVLSGVVTIPIAVEAVKLGAFDVIEKALDPQIIVERTRTLMRAWKIWRDNARARSMAFPGVERLSQRERDVLAEITAAASNKEAGRSLGLSPRTVEAHRAHIMQKLGAKNTADLVRLVLRSRSS